MYLYIVLYYIIYYYIINIIILYCITLYIYDCISSLVLETLLLQFQSPLLLQHHLLMLLKQGQAISAPLSEDRRLSLNCILPRVADGLKALQNNSKSIQNQFNSFE